MFGNNGIANNGQNLTKDLSTYLLHKEALRQYNDMNTALSNSNTQCHHSLLDYRFQILGRAMKEEEQRGEQLLQEAFARSQQQQQQP